METNPNIARLLEMLENPEAYSEQEICDIIDCDDETREAYRLMVAAKQGYIHQQEAQPVDVNAAWRQFEQSHLRHQQPARKWPKMAASFIGLLLASGIAFAAIHIVRQYQKAEAPQAADTTAVAKPSLSTTHSSLPEDTVTVQPVIYDNIPLEKMLPEIATHYGVKVTFQNDEARQLRFHFVWNPQQDMANVVSDLNHFERLHATLKDNQLIVE